MNRPRCETCYKGDMVWKGSGAYIGKERVTDKMLATFCDDCRDAALSDLNLLLIADRERGYTTYFPYAY